MLLQDETSKLGGYGTSTRLFDSMRSFTGDQKAFKLSVRDWMTGYNDEMDKFPSMALFLEMKLKEAFSVPVRSEPDP